MLEALVLIFVVIVAYFIGWKHGMHEMSNHAIEVVEKEFGSLRKDFNG